MKRRIRELANGQVEYKLPEFTVQPEKIEGRLSIDGLHREEILLESKNQVPIKGVAYSSHGRVHVVRPTFFGRRCSVCLEINTVGISGQGMIDGTLTLVTNGGTFLVPYSFKMQEKSYGTEERVVRTIEDFAEFVKEDEKRALRLFKSKSFVTLPFMHDAKRLALYQALLTDRDERKNLEEFLVCSKAKEPLVYEIVSEPLKLTGVFDKQQRLVIKKSTWGCATLHISADQPFILPARKSVTTDEFVADADRGDILTLEFSIIQEHLRPGKNEGHLIIKSSAIELSFPVSVFLDEMPRQTIGDKYQGKKITAEIYKRYIAYRAAFIDEREDASFKLSKLIEFTKKVVADSPDDWEKKLFLSYFYLLANRANKADRYLEEVRDDVMQNRIPNIFAYCFFLYLRAIFNNSDDQMETAAKLIAKYYAENPENHALMLLLLKADITYRENESFSLLRLKELDMEGCNSPILYLEACKDYRKCPDLLRMPNDFELQVMSFGARYKLLSEELALTAAQVASRDSHYKPITMRLLSNIYTKYPKREILESICSYLIRCSCKAEEFFSWYEQGIQGGLSLVGLNEAYLSSLPKDWNEPLPQELLLYFAYSQDLRGDVKEILYENILLHYNEDSQIYKEYAEQMDEYALEQLLAGRISRKLAPLYRHLIVQEMIDERLAKVLPDLLMAYEITCENPEMRKVIVRCPELNYEDSYKLEKGVCCAPVYTDDTLIMFVDKYNNRYVDVPYEKTLLFSGPKLLKKCEEVYPDHLIFMVKKCMAELNKSVKDGQSPGIMNLMNQLLLSADVSAFFKSRIISRMLDYYLNNKEQAPATFLKNLDIRTLSYHDRRKALEIMVNGGQLSESYTYISQNGFNGLRHATLSKIALRRIREVKGAPEQFLLDLCVYLFEKDKCSAEIIAYLCRHYNATNEQMRRLLFLAVENNIPLSDLPERLMAQMLFCGDVEEIKRVYEIYKTLQNAKEVVLRAYIVTCCYQYFVNDIMIDENVFIGIVHTLFSEDTGDILRAEYEENDIINISLLYYLTKNENVIPSQNEICGRLLDRLCKKGLLFGFYTLLWGKVDFPAQLNGKFLLEHRARSAGRVFLTMKHTGMDDSLTVQMQKMFDGIFVAQVVLFSDETLEYSIAEEHGGKQQVVIEREMTANDMAFVRSGSVFEAINEMGVLFKSGQEKLLEDALIRHETKQFVTEKLFKPL